MNVQKRNIKNLNSHVKMDQKNSKIDSQNIKLPQNFPYLFPNQLNPGSTLKLGFLIYSLFVSENPRDLPNGIKFSHPKVLTE
jgi:hypothetical protein